MWLIFVVVIILGTGGGCYNNFSGGDGGGAIRLNVSNQLIIDGVISSNGQYGYNGWSGRSCGGLIGGIAESPISLSIFITSMAFLVGIVAGIILMFRRKKIQKKR